MSMGKLTLKGQCQPYTGSSPIEDVRSKIWRGSIGTKPMQCTVIARCSTKNCVNSYHLGLETDADKEHMSRKKRHPSSKLTDAQVIDIRRKGKEGETQAQLAAAYGVCQRTIGCILRGETYKKVLDK